MSAPDRIFVAYGRHGASTVSEYRDEAEAQHDTIATEYVSLGVHEAEVTRLRAVLQAILALKTTHDAWDSGTCADAFGITEEALGS